MLKQVQHDKLRSDIPLILPFSPRRRNIQSSPLEILRSAQCDEICTSLTLNAKRIDGWAKKLYNASMVNVSVIIPVYNVEKYLARCLDTVLAQSFDGDFEVICVNDGSTDFSPKILEAYAKSDSRIRVINRVNGGLSSARNVGMSVAKGDYFLFVDSDDWISTNTLEVLYKNATENNSDIVLFGYVKANSDLSPKTFLGVPECRQFGVFNAETIPECILKLFPVSAWSKFYKAEFLKNNNITFYENIIYEDVPFWAEVFTQANAISYVNEALYFYRENREGQITKQVGESVFDIVKCYESVEVAYKKRNLWEKYKHSIQMLLMLDFMSKYYIVQPELRPKLFEIYKSQNKIIDYDYFYGQKLFDFEERTFKRFQKLNSSSFEEFENYLKGEQNANT